jgi:hypothetical protein
MNEKDVRTINIIKALCPPFIYFFITMLVEVVVDIVLFVKQTKSITNKGMAVFLDSYSFMENIDANMDKYSYVITLLSAMVAIVVFGIWYYKISEEYENNGFKSQFEYKELSKNLWQIVLLGIFGSLGLGRFVSLLPLDNIIGNYETTSKALMGGNLAIQIISLAIIVPIAEELIYRGLVFTGLAKVIGGKYAILLASIIFGIFHFNLLQGTYAFLLSLILVCVYMKYRTILAPIIIHSVANLVAVISNYYGISEFLNKNLFIYMIIMILELVVAVLMFVLIFGDEEA